jgi:hypothetical protein
LSSTDLIGPYESSIPGAKQELGLDERAEERVTRGPIQTPESLCLLRRQPQARHLDELTLHAPENIFQ